MNDNFRKDVEYIMTVLKNAGYNPMEQLYAFAVTGNETYITRKGEARSLVKNLDREKLIEYLTESRG